MKKSKKAKGRGGAKKEEERRPTTKKEKLTSARTIKKAKPKKAIVKSKKVLATKATKERRTIMKRKTVDYNNAIITIEDLAKAILNRIGGDKRQPLRDAEYIMNIFGFDDEIIDNVLEPGDRQLFYILEDEDLLGTRREETTISDGREWRTHYWMLKKDEIQKAMHEEPRKLKRTIVEAEPYEDIPEEIWYRD